MSRLFDKEGHVSIETIYRLKERKLNDADLMKLLDHIAECVECAGILSESYNENELVEVPEGFEENIKFKINGINHKKFNFNFYCIKVIAAASIAILMLFSNELNSIIGINVKNLEVSDYNKTISVCSNLNSFAEKIINLEVFK